MTTRPVPAVWLSSLLFCVGLACSASDSQPPSEASPSTDTHVFPRRDAPPGDGTPPGGGPGAPQTNSQAIYFTTMTHMEEGHTDDVNEGTFLLHVEQIRTGLALASEYGAKLTIESEQPFARANQVWDLNVMQEILDAGHGVGTHCDIGGTFTGDVPANVEEFAAMFAANKSLVDALVGAENNKGCSGGASSVDWVKAASMAGFEYLCGIVGGHYLSMPIEERPSRQWTDDFILNFGFHSEAPHELTDRIYPRMLADALDFEHDNDGVIALMAGGIGAFVDNCAAGKTCTMTPENVDALVAEIQEIEAFRDKERFAKLTVYLSVGQLDNEDDLRYFLERMKALQDEGVIQWATQLEAYEAYEASRKTRGPGEPSSR